MASRHSPFCATSTPKATCDFASPRASANAGAVVSATKESVQTRERINMWPVRFTISTGFRAKQGIWSASDTLYQQAMCHASSVEFQPDCIDKTPGTYETSPESLPCVGAEDVI